MSSSDLLGIGASGTRAYRAALGAISENITNANTENYNRRTVRLTESAASSATTALSSPWATFGGVEINGVTRSNDLYLDAAARLTGNVLGSAATRERWLGDVETALNDNARGIGSRLTEMFSAAERLASSPNDDSLRTNFLFGVEQTVTAFRETARDLQLVQDGIGNTADIEVSALNDALRTLAISNEGLRRVNRGSSAEAQLLDSRDAALADISRRLDVGTTFKDRGVVSLSFGGVTIVEDVAATSFSVTRNANGTLNLMHEGAPIANPAGGTMAGLFQSAEVTAQRIASVDNLANSYVEDLNSWHAQGKTRGGDPGGALLAINGGASTMTLLTHDLADIATESTDGRANGNLLNMNSIRGSGRSEYNWTALVAAHANTTTATKAESEAAQTRNQQARTAREDVSGVDLDLEAAELLRLQQAYQGSAKIIQVAREIMQSIMGIF